MHHETEAPHFVGQVRSMFHFGYAFLHLILNINIYAKSFFSALILLCKLFAFCEKGAGCETNLFRIRVTFLILRLNVTSRSAILSSLIPNPPHTCEDRRTEQIRVAFPISNWMFLLCYAIIFTSLAFFLFFL